MKLTALVTADGESCNADFTFAIIKVNLTAHRPDTEFFLFFKHPIPDDDEETPGAGIRLRNSQTLPGQPSDPGDMIKLIIESSDGGNPPIGMKYVLKRDNEFLQVWTFPAPQIGDERFGPGELEHEVFVLPADGMYNGWVENIEQGQSSLTFEARDSETDEVFASDKIVFNTFTSIVIALTGEGLSGGDPFDSGITTIAQALYDPSSQPGPPPGYDVHLYDEDDVNSNGAGPVFDEVVDAIQDRGVDNVAIFGHSHGGGSTHDLAMLLSAPPQGTPVLNYTLRFTGYIDAIKNFLDSATAAEDRLPPNSMSHVNFWEDITLFPLPHGAPTAPPGPITNIYVNGFPWGANLTHTTIDNSFVVQAGIESALRSATPTP